MGTETLICALGDVIFCLADALCGSVNMPSYVYRCKTRGLTFERRQRMTDASLTDRPECGGEVHLVIQPVPILFRARGLHVTVHKRAGPSTSGPDTGQEPQDEGEQKEKTEKAKASSAR